MQFLHRVLTAALAKAFSNFFFMKTPQGVDPSGTASSGTRWYFQQQALLKEILTLQTPTP